MRKFLFPVLLGVFSIVLTALFLEAAVRLVADDGMQFDLEMWKYARDVKVVSADPSIGHEHGAQPQSASDGRRCRDELARLARPRIHARAESGRATHPDDRRFTDIRLGRSLRGDIFQAHRETVLDAGREVEVINTGVGNWNTVQEVSIS